MKKRDSIILSFSILIYVFAPVAIQAQSISQTKSLTYFYSGSDLINSQDDNGLMSSYLGKTVRTIIDTNNNSIVQTNSLISDGKSIIAQTDDTGTNINNTQQYTPYGVPSSSLKTLNLKPKTSADVLNIWQNPFQYDGYYYDQESDLDYLQARYYNPILMHFISMDTYDLANRYAYCNGNPIMKDDQSGHIPFLNVLEEMAKSLNPIPDSSSTTDLLNAAVNIFQDLNMLDGEGELSFFCKKFIAENANIVQRGEEMFLNAANKEIKLDSNTDKLINKHLYAQVYGKYFNETIDHDGNSVYKLKAEEEQKLYSKYLTTTGSACVPSSAIEAQKKYGLEYNKIKSFIDFFNAGDPKPCPLREFLLETFNVQKIEAPKFTDGYFALRKEWADHFAFFRVYGWDGHITFYNRETEEYSCGDYDGVYNQKGAEAEVDDYYTQKKGMPPLESLFVFIPNLSNI